MRDKIFAVLQAGVREMRLVTTVGKERDNQNKSGQQRGRRDAERTCERPASSFANENGQ